MNEKEEMPSNEAMEKAAMISMEWIDIQPVARALEAEYRRGYEDAKKIEYQRGRDDYRDDILARMDAARPGSEVPKFLPPKAPVAPQKKPEPEAAPQARPESEATQVAPEPEKRTPELPKTRERAPRDNIRGDTRQPRPVNIPTTFEMVATVLDETPSLTALEVGAKIRTRWWPGMDFKRIGPEFSTWIREGRLERNGDGKLTLTPRGRKVAFPAGKSVEKLLADRAPAPKQEPAPQAPSPLRQVVTPGAKLGPPARQNGIDFKHGDKTVVLHQREAEIMVRLRSAMGRGHLDAKFLANSIGIKSEAEMTMRDFVSILNPKIAALGLRVDWFNGFGFILKEIAQ